MVYIEQKRTYISIVIKNELRIYICGYLLSKHNLRIVSSWAERNTLKFLSENFLGMEYKGSSFSWTPKIKSCLLTSSHPMLLNFKCLTENP